MASDPDTEQAVSQGQEHEQEIDDVENSEEIRRQLKNTTIAPTMGTAAMVVEQDREASTDAPVSSVPAGAENGDNVEGEAQDQGEARGRLRKKRSIDEVEAEIEDGEGEKQGKQARKRSRDGEDGDKEEQSRDVGDNVLDASATATMDTGKSIPTESANGGLKNRPETPDVTIGDEEMDSVTSPKNKRTRDQFLQESDKAAESVDGSEDKEDEAAESSKPAKRARDKSSPQAEGDVPGDITEKVEEKKELKMPSSSGFANASAVSPFGSLTTVTSPKSPSSQPQTSTSAFAASAFGKLASGSASPFAATGASSSASPFGALSSTTKPTLSSFGDAGASSKTTPSAFGGSLGATSGAGSPFVPTKPTSVLGASTSSTSGFGTLGSSRLNSGGFGSGFAAVAKPGGGLTSFATPGATGIVGLSNKPALPFGAKADDDADEEEDEESDGEEGEEKDKEKREGIKSPVPTEEKKDRRFFEQTVLSGEENEMTIFSCRAKLFVFTTSSTSPEKKEWKERGVGTLKLNVMEEQETENENANETSDPLHSTQYSKPTPSPTTSQSPSNSLSRARLVMRADGSQRVILNSPVNAKLKFGTADGQRPTSGTVLFQGMWEGSLQLLTLRMKQQFAEELWDQVSHLNQQGTK
ncbi:hypothetical protein NA57DRAFT_81916 [Rhizodiscina lignyota]|uniref:RanBD1 domain-containing protein n=1 Tax=Rhizodiscina lignyota TaxID=1504668 RepID=A0A9P4I402_9PEZI|nr:hypothetical protein NA57DRAFT_81916 [Rhizodiscina lignyota]